ncbi:MAG TPA: glycosyltransferase [Gemmatimonadales bacterium]|nr:glycosyltransferase [Gemmatimonadales bacterium]
MLEPLGYVLIAIPVALFFYALVVYPALLWLLARLAPAPRRWDDPAEWPTISILIPAYNEEEAIAGTLESLLALDYPPERRQIVVMSDASTDRTDEIVRGFAGRGVRLVRMPQRKGKTAAENVTLPQVDGDIVVNTDATIRIPPASLKPLLRVFQDPTIGASSGRDVSVGDLDAEGNAGEGGYVGYEMGLRALETRLGGIIGASGCFYAIRRKLVDTAFPEALSRDFASPLRARLLGYRTVSVDEAVCVVPRTRSLHAEYRRKIRTMQRGLNTLWHMRALMNPFVYGRFACMLVSHKLVRWLGFLAAPLAPLGVLLLAPTQPWAAALAVLGAAGVAAGIVGMRWRSERAVPRPLATLGYALASAIAGLLAWKQFFQGTTAATWEPTRRPA